MRQKVQIVVLVLYQDNFELLLLQTNQLRGAFWQNITGAVEKGESSLAAAQRELQEETGIYLQNLQKLEISWQFIDQYQRAVLEECYLCLLDKKPTITLSDEHQNYQWKKSNQVQENDYRFFSNYQTFLTALKRAQY